MIRADSKKPAIPSGVELELALAAQLRALLATISWIEYVEVKPSSLAGKDDGFDLEAFVQVPGLGRVKLAVECKTEVRPSQVAMMAQARRRGHPGIDSAHPVLAAPRISPQVTETCAQFGWSWFDLAGNCRIDIPGRIHLHIEGRELPYQWRPVSNLGTIESTRILRTLLDVPNIGRPWRQRDLQACCHPSVSLGLVHKVVHRLREEGFIDASGQDGFQVHNHEGLLNLWRDYNSSPRHGRRQYLADIPLAPLHQRLAPLAAITGDRAAYALYTAAESLSEQTWIYLDAAYLSELERIDGIRTTNDGANLVVLLPEDAGVFFGQIESGLGRLPSTSLVQTYVDLWHDGALGQRAAERLLETKIKPHWKLS